MRTAFIRQLIKEARLNERIFLVVGDLGFHVVEEYADTYPDRFLNVGICEQNMMGVAAGLSMEGYSVYVYSIGNFPTLRCMEQIRYDVAYHNLDVKIIAVGGGFAYGSLGASHHATEDIGMLRTIPNMTVCAPGDPMEATVLTAWSARYAGPVYMRIGKMGEPIIHRKEIGNVDRGDLLLLLKGRKTAVLSTGSILMDAYNTIMKRQLGYGLYSCPFIKPMNKMQLREIASEYDEIITIEEHQRSAGFGSVILEQFNDMIEGGGVQNIPSVRRIAIPDLFYHISGSQDYLANLAGLQL